jgi:hypothetical protein
MKSSFPKSRCADTGGAGQPDRQTDILVQSWTQPAITVTVSSQDGARSSHNHPDKPQQTLPIPVAEKRSCDLVGGSAIRL